MRVYLGQTVKPGEIIIVDDGSSDNTEEISLSFASQGVRYIKKEHQGISATRNAGVRCSGGNFLAFLDVDDIWKEDKLEKQRALLEL